MRKYYVNKNPQPNGDHEVHTESCSWLNLVENKMYLGEFYNCHGAVQEAKKTYPTANGCYYCSRDCHTS